MNPEFQPTTSLKIELDLLSQLDNGAVSEWEIALIGPDWQRSGPRLARLIHRLGLSLRVHLVDPRRGCPLHGAFAGADLFVLISRFEGLPFALLDA